MMARMSTRRTRLISATLILAVAISGFYVLARMAPTRGVEVAADAPRPVKPFPSAEAGVFDEAFAQGIRAFNVGDAHAAAIAFERATAIDPTSADAFANLGFAYVELQSWQRAKASFERALMINPEQANAYFGLAETFEGQGELTTASSAMRTFLFYAPAGDPFRRRAEAAIWEWNAGSPRPAHEFLGPETPSLRLAAGEPVFTLAAQDLQRRPAPLSNFEGKALVLNIWASWCPPCRRELPALDSLARELDPEKFAVVGLNVDASPDFVSEYLRELGVGFPNLWDYERRLADGAFDVDAYPTTLLIGPNGVVKERIVGYRDWNSKENLRKIKALQE